MSRFGPKALYGLRDIIFPSRALGFQDELCAAVLAIDKGVVIHTTDTELEQLFSILNYANRSDKVNLILDRCRTWSSSLSEQIDQLLDQLGSPLDTVLPGPMPFFDRTDLRGCLDEILDPKIGARILVIKGPSPSGKSHSFTLIGRVGRGRAGADVQRIPLDEFATDDQLEPVDLMTAIANKFHISTMGMPDKRRAQDARITQKLINWFVGAFNGRERPEQTVWLVLDGFNLPGCPTWVHDFAGLLAVQSATEQVDMLLFLIGFDETRLPSECDFVHRVEHATQPTADHVWEFINAYARSRQFMLDAALKRPMLDAVFKSITLPADHAELKLIAKRAVDIVKEGRRLSISHGATSGQ
jgi:hypothetical protein